MADVYSRHDVDFTGTRHWSEQYFTPSQFFSHFLRQVIGLPQSTQGLLGRLRLLPRNSDARSMPSLRKFPRPR